MDWLKVISMMLEHIELRLTDPTLSAETLSRTFYLSTTHLQRAFSILTGMSIGEYIRNRRLSSAALALKEGNSVMETALAYCYETPEAFNKAFKRFHGVSPSEVRSKTVSLIAYPPLQVKLTLKGELPMNYTLVDKPSMMLVGTSIEVSNEHESNKAAIPKFWNQVNTDGTCESIAALPGIQAVVGACIMDDPKAESFTYAVAGLFDKPIQDTAFKSWSIAPHTWAIFECIGPMPTAIQDLWQRIFSEWFPATGFEHAPAPELEIYPPGDPSSSDYRCEIWIPVIKK